MSRRVGGPSEVLRPPPGPHLSAHYRTILAERGGSPALASPLVVYYKITKIAALWRGDSLPLTHHGLPPFPWVFSSGGFSQNPTETRPMVGKFQESSKKSCTDKAHFGKPPGLAPPISVAAPARLTLQPLRQYLQGAKKRLGPYSCRHMFIKCTSMCAPFVHQGQYTNNMIFFILWVRGKNYLGWPKMGPGSSFSG